MWRGPRAFHRITLPALVLAAVVLLASSSHATAQEPMVANVAPVPPPGGLTTVVAGTTDVQALIDAQHFAVASAWKFDIATQQWQSFVVGAPVFVNSLSTLSHDDVVTLKAAPPVSAASTPSGRRPNTVSVSQLGATSISMHLVHGLRRAEVQLRST